MKLTYVPQGKEDYCIVDEDEWLVHQYKKAFDDLFLRDQRTLRTLSSIRITKINVNQITNALPDDVTTDYKKWFNNNINNIDEDTDEPKETVIPF